VSYDLRCIFSGPCAYVPNTLSNSGTPLPDVESWSVIMPQLKFPVRVAQGDPPIPPHYAVLVYPTDLFQCNFAPDLIFRRGLGPELGLVLLAGDRVRIRSTETQPFTPHLGTVTHLEPPPPSPPSDELRSLRFLPPIGELLTGAGKVGNDERPMFDGRGLPIKGMIAGHVLINEGRLFTNALTHEEGNTTDAPGIWGFRVTEQDPQSIDPRAVAHSVGLELSGLTLPLEIELTNESGTRLLWLKTVPAVGVAQIEIKNREFDEIVGCADSMISEGDVDRDFKILYRFSKSDNRACPLPFLVQDEGLGTRRTTCSGALFDNFDSVLFESTLSQWEAFS
jgi:hypothetical protein